MSKIYISVSGGCVNAVYSTNKKDDVELWDWDNIKTEVENTQNLENEWENEIVYKLHKIF